MHPERHLRLLSGAGIIVAALALAACDVTVRRPADREGRSDADRGRSDADLDVRTPLGDMTVRQGDSRVAERVGLPIYAGAEPVRGRRHDNADVQIDTPLFAVDVAAMTYRTTDEPEAVVDFYRDELARLGRVTECEGEIDFGRGDRVRCREEWRSQTQLVVGSRGDHRIVTVKPRRGGSEFALVHIAARGGFD
jgi:hypothetical protein